jgi:hypothetical protein
MRVSDGQRRNVVDIDAIFLERLRDVHVGLQVVWRGRIVGIERLLQGLVGGRRVH